MFMPLLYRRYPYCLMPLGSDDGGVRVEITLHDYAGFRIPRRIPALPCANGPPATPRPRRGRSIHHPWVTPPQVLPQRTNPGARGRAKTPSRGRLALSPETERIHGKGGARRTFGGLHPGRLFALDIPWRPGNTPEKATKTVITISVSTAYIQQYEQRERPAAQEDHVAAVLYNPLQRNSGITFDHPLITRGRGNASLCHFLVYIFSLLDLT